MSGRVLWSAFVVMLAVIWASGAWHFARSALTLRRKIAWTLLLLGIGGLAGFLLPLEGIRDRLLIVLALLPLLAVVDVKLAKSSRTFSFWLRACAFEVCTVFGVAALTRLALDARLGST